MTAAKAPQTRSIFIQQRGQSALIVDDIPANAKITFGPVQPGKQGYGGEGNALRIYTTAGNQLGVFLDVVSFRDLSLKVKQRKVTKKLKSNAEIGPNGKVSEDSYEETYEWNTVEL